MTEPTTLSPELAAQLEALRDIHLPQAVSWWPLAPGWWALMVLAVVAVVALIVARAMRRRTVRYRALAELDALRRRRDLDVADGALAIEVLLKRVVLQRAHLSDHAATHGTRWVSVLAEGPDGMPLEIATYIAAAPYAARAANENEAPDREALFASARRWIRRHT